MNAYVVWPLDTLPHPVYVSEAFKLQDGWALEAKSPEQAARAVRGEHPVAPDRFRVLGPEGLTVIDLSVVEGFETLSLDERSHR